MDQVDEPERFASLAQEHRDVESRLAMLHAQKDRLPASWRILYRDGAAWRPVVALDSYGVEKDAYNKVAFVPVTTTGLRLEVTLPPQWSSGIQEWKVK